jgi:hypothetical protein
MTKINDAYGTVTLNGVTNLQDIPLRELWLAYAAALGPFDFCLPNDTNGDAPRPNVDSELRLAHHAFHAVRASVHATRDHTDFSRAMSHWLKSVDLAGGFHGIRPVFLRNLATLRPIVPLAAEPLMRARVDDAMIRLEGRNYAECYAHVLSELSGILSPVEYRGLRNHVLSMTLDG